MIILSRFCVSIIALVGICVVAGCSNPSYSTRKNDFDGAKWESIAILPFKGDPRFSAEMTQVFAGSFLNVKGLRLVQPSTTATQVSRGQQIDSGDGTYSIIEARQVGTSINVDAVMIGSVTAYNNGSTLNGFCTVQLIDVSTGEIVASCHYPSGLLIGYSEHHGVMKATQRCADDMVKYLESLKR